MDSSNRYRRTANSNPSSSSSSSTTSSTNFRSQKFAPNYRSSNFNSNSRRTAAPSDTRNLLDSVDGRTRPKVIQHHQSQKKEEIHEDCSDANSIVGTCLFMCPEDERNQRERLRDLAVFERLHGDPRKTSPNLAVKKFCRTISTRDVQPSDVRPLSVLEDTLNYLLNLLDSTEHPFEVVHDFVFDRTRSIRQDLSMQNIVNDRAIHMYEEMVKFHVRSQHRLQNCSSSSNMSSILHLNLEQLKKALTSLYNLYEENRKSKSIYENEAEFRSFYVLLHLGSETQPMGESLSLWFRSVSSLIIHSKEMCFARKILRLFRMGNYKCFFFTTATEGSSLQYCILEPYVNQVRALALACINNGGYKLHPYPLEHLSKLLMIKESDLEAFCSSCGLVTSTDETGNKLLPTKQTTFCHPNKGLKNYSVMGFDQFNRPARN